MNLEEFRARFDELRRMREFVSAVPLSDRLTELCEAYLEAADLDAKNRRMEALRASIEVSEIQAQTPEPPVGDGHFYVAPGIETRALLSEAAEEIAAHKEDGYDPDEVPPIELEGEPVTTKPELPAEDKGNRKAPAGASDSTRDQDGEPEKPCKTCGETKPLSEFYKSPGMKEGHRNQCKDCVKDQQAQRTVTKLPRTERTPEPEKKKTEKKTRPEQLCGNGEDCVGFEHMGRPTKLNSRNTTGVCMACEDREREAGLSSYPGHIVRKRRDGSTGT